LSYSDVDSYTYSAGSTLSGPHALSYLCGQAGRLTNPIYNYDAHGNITSVVSVASGMLRTHTWTSFYNPAN
jgi:hypothetical protein